MKWSVRAAATEWGCDRERLTRCLKQIGLQVGAGSEFTTKEIDKALHGDIGAVLLRRETADAEKAEVEAAVAKKTHMPREDVAWFIRENFSPLRELVVALPGQLAGLVNPADPQHAKSHLERWRDEYLRHKEKMPPRPESVDNEED